MNKITKVFQDSFGEKGSCYTACIASMLSIDFKDVPRFVDLTAHLSEKPEERAVEWFKLVDEFLLSHGYKVLHYDEPQVVIDWAKNIDEDFFFIMTGKSPRSQSRNHAVIFNKDKAFHDPNPEGTFLVENLAAQIIVSVEDES